MAKVFLSHSSQDKEFVEQLANDLDKANISVWLEKWSIPLGGSIVSYIEEGLSESDYLLVILSPASVKSRWVKLELDAALMAGLSDQSITVIPLLIENCEIPTLLKSYRWIDFRNDYDVGLQSLLSFLSDEMRLLPSLPQRDAARAVRTLGEWRVVLNSRLSLEEVKDIALDLEIDFENLEGPMKNARIRSLLQLLSRTQRLNDLFSWLDKHRLDVD